MYDCEYCEETFEFKRSLGGHVAAKHVNETCSFCGENFSSANISEHERACDDNPKNVSECGRSGCHEAVKNGTYCSKSCAAKVNNQKHPKRAPEGGICDYCGDKKPSRNRRFCSNACQRSYFRSKRLNEIAETGVADFDVSEETNRLWMKRYLIREHGEECMKCGWSETNPHTGNIPIELHHKGGDHRNHSVNNCELLCPNCHSLTESYKGANLGSGRKNRV